MNPLRNKWQQKRLAMDVTHPEVQVMADAAEVFCRLWFKNDHSKPMLVLAGNPGCGKTHVAKAVYKFAVKMAMAAFDSRAWGERSVPSSRCLSWPLVCSEINEKRYGLVEDLIDHDLAVIDDVGAENDPWKVCADRLCQILSRREGRFTLVTTNIQPKDWAERFDARISDRLFRQSMVVDLSQVPSYSIHKLTTA